MAAIEPRGESLQNLCHPMCQILLQGVTPRKLFPYHVVVMAPRGKPLQNLYCPMYQLCNQWVIPCNFFWYMWYLRTQVITPCNPCVSPCCRYIPKGGPVVKFVSDHVTATANMWGSLATFLPSHVASMAPRDNPLHNLCQKMWQIWTQGGTPCKIICQTMCYLLTKGVTHCKSLFRQGWTLFKHLCQPMWHICPQRGSPWKTICDMCQLHTQWGVPK